MASLGNPRSPGELVVMRFVELKILKGLLSLKIRFFLIFFGHCLMFFFF